MFLFCIYLLCVIFCGWAAWVTRKTEIKTYGDLIIASGLSLIPFFNILIGLMVLEQGKWFSREIKWDKSH